MSGGGGVRIDPDDDDNRPGGRATGGSVQKGRIYRVNETATIGPEYFVAPENGAILNQMQAQAAMTEALKGSPEPAPQQAIDIHFLEGATIASDIDLQGAIWQIKREIRRELLNQ